MDPKLLSQLFEVVAQGSLSRAAQTLKVTQPTLTRNMKAIEAAVGAPVLQRYRHGVTPTSLGKRLTEQGRIITAAMSTADDTVQQWRTGLIGEVRLGIGALLSASLIPDFFAAKPMKNSNFTVSVVAAEPAELMQKLRNQEIDLAILPANANLPQSKVMQEPLYADEYCVVAGSRSPLINTPGKIKPHTLLNQTWMAINNTTHIRHIHDQVAITTGIDRIVPKFRFEGDVTTPMALLRESNMLAFAPRQFAKKHAAIGGIHILDIDAEFPKRDIVLTINKENENTSITMELSRLIKEYFSDFDHSTAPDVQNTAVQQTNEVHAMDLP